MTEHDPFAAVPDGARHAALAELEARIALRALSDRLPDLRLGVPASDLRREPALLSNKLLELPVRLGPDTGQQ